MRHLDDILVDKDNNGLFKITSKFNNCGIEIYGTKALRLITKKNDETEIHELMLAE